MLKSAQYSPRRIARSLLGAFVVIHCIASVGALRPSFLLDYSSWHSTDIILVTTTAVGDEFEVIDSWKGDLHPGDHVLVPELKPKVTAIPVWLYPDDSLSPEATGSTEIPKQLAGSRLVLFLKRVSPTPKADSARRHTGLRWLPSSLFDDMKSSVVWIDGSRLYRFIQTTNPGPSTLQPWDDLSEEKLREHVAEVVRVEQELTGMVQIKNSALRAAALKPYVRSDIQPARNFAEEELGKCGPQAIPVIQGILDDEDFSDFSQESSSIVKALARAGGAAEGSDLTARLGRDLEFWRNVGPSLHQGWWNDDPTPASPLRNRYGQTLELIRALDEIQFPGALSTAVALRDFWRSLTQLDDPSGLNQMSQESDKLIQDLQQSGKH